MKDAAPQPIHLADYCPPSHLVEEVQLTFRLEPGATRVLSKIRFRGTPQRGWRGTDGSTMARGAADHGVDTRPAAERAIRFICLTIRGADPCRSNACPGHRLHHERGGGGESTRRQHTALEGL